MILDFHTAYASSTPTNNTRIGMMKQLYYRHSLELLQQALLFRGFQPKVGVFKKSFLKEFLQNNFKPPSTWNTYKQQMYERVRGLVSILCKHFFGGAFCANFKKKCAWVSQNQKPSLAFIDLRGFVQFEVFGGTFSAQNMLHTVWLDTSGMAGTHRTAPQSHFVRNVSQKRFRERYGCLR